MIFVWLPGGSPHLDMYDMKPNLSSEYRGEFRADPDERPRDRSQRVDATPR